MERTAILIPAYNASEALPELFHRLQPYIGSSGIIVVDDGSSDTTMHIARDHGVTVLRHERNFGKGRALRTGFEHIISMTNYHAVVTMDADLQHQPEDLPIFFSVREMFQPDMIIGYRKRWGTNMPLSRKLSNSITSSLLSTRTGRKIRDSQCGFRLISRKVLEEVRTTVDGYEAETEHLIKAARKGFSIEFVPIKTVYGNEKSHMTHVPTTLRFLNVLLKEY
ncbi:MAG: glycosyltransferase family 2 protein [Ignavibacteriae bacterium]|nr:glycosyltransferase family 2 protein [Ignavibacteriota bacterium]